MKVKNVILAIAAAIIITFLLVIAFGSGVLSSTTGIVYTAIIIVACGIIFFIGRKVYLDQKEGKKIAEVVNDPEKLYNKLKENKAIIDGGKEVEISLQEDPQTGKKSVDIKLGKKVDQDWRKKFEMTPVKKEESKAKEKKDQKKDQKQQPQKH